MPISDEGVVINLLLIEVHAVRKHREEGVPIWWNVLQHRQSITAHPLSWYARQRNFSMGICL
jgi:hypothetical protein